MSTLKKKEDRFSERKNEIKWAVLRTHINVLSLSLHSTNIYHMAGIVWNARAQRQKPSRRKQSPKCAAENKVTASVSRWERRAQGRASESSREREKY